MKQERFFDEIKSLLEINGITVSNEDDALEQIDLYIKQLIKRLRKAEHALELVAETTKPWYYGL